MTEWRQARGERHTARLALLAAACVCLWPLLCSGVTIDRIAVVVGNQVITESELILEIRITSFLNEEPVNLSPQAKREAANRLIQQKLVRREMQLTRYPAPSPSDVEPALQKLIHSRFRNNESEFQRALQKYGLTEKDLKAHLLWQLTFLRFIDLRFRPGIQVTESEIEDYFKTRILPLEKVAHPGQTVTLDDFRDRIENVLTGQRVDEELNAWLKRTRARTTIEFREDAFQ